MNKEQFLKELEERLKGIPEQEREAALTYYREYFEEAGADREAVVISELESPKRVAETIMSDISERQVEYSGNGTFQNGIYEEAHNVSNEKTTKKSNKTVWIVLACVLGGLLVVGGILMFLVNLFIGHSINYVTKSVNEVIEHAEWVSSPEDGDFSKIQCSIGAGEIFIHSNDTDEIRVVAVNVGNAFNPHISDDTFYLEDNKNFFVFGDTSEIYIYLPERIYESVVIDLGAGTGYVENLSAKNISVDVGAGEIEAEALEAEEKISLNIGAGVAELLDLYAKDFEIECGIGETNVSGKIEGNGSINCGVGSVSLDLEGDMADYNYDVICELGEVCIGSENISMGSSYLDNGALRKITVNCSVGEVNVE